MDVEIMTKYASIEKGRKEVLALLNGGNGHHKTGHTRSVNTLIESDYLHMLLEKEDQILQLNQDFKEFLSIKKRLSGHKAKGENTLSAKQ